MCHIHASIVSMHLTTRGNNKIPRTPPPHISSSKERLPPTHSSHPFSTQNKQITLSQIILTHSRRQITSITTMPPLQHPHTPSLQLHPHTHHTVTPGFVDRPRWSAGVADQIEVYAGWWTKSGMIGLPTNKGQWSG